MIENVLGFRRADGLERTLTWDLKESNGTHGLRHLRWGDIDASLVYDAPSRKVSISTNRPFTLILNGQSHSIPTGDSLLPGPF